MDLNLHMIRGVMNFLDIDKEFVMASSLGVSGKKTDLIVAQCNALSSETYLSEAGGRDYLDYEKFKKEGIKVEFQNFKYPFTLSCGEILYRIYQLWIIFSVRVIKLNNKGF